MKDYDTLARLHPITEETLARENRQYTGTGGISTNNRDQGFIPAFLDTATGHIYLSRFPNGNPAPVHVLDSLPDELVAGDSRSNGHRVIKSSVVSGFVRQGAFYSREEAAQAVSAQERLH